MLRAWKAILVVVAVLLAGLIIPGTASAGPVRNGICDDGEVCFYYNSNQGGVLSDMNYPLADYKTGAACNHFLKPGGASAGICLKNNSASVWNRTRQIAVVFYNSGYAGPSQSFNPGVKANFNSTLKNENASHTFKNVPTPPNVCPNVERRESLGGLRWDIKVSFRGSDLCDGRHVQQVYVHLHNSCGFTGLDNGRRYSGAARDQADTTPHGVSDWIMDSLIPNCDTISNATNIYF